MNQIESINEEIGSGSNLCADAKSWDRSDENQT